METSVDLVIDLGIEKNVELLQAALLVAMPSARGALLGGAERCAGGAILASRAMECGDTVWGWSADPQCVSSAAQWTAACPMGGRFFSRFYSIGN